MKNNLWNILKKEIKELFRDKKSLMMMLIIPFMIPLLVLGMSALFEMQMNKPITDYNSIGFNYQLSEIEKEIAKSLNINIVTNNDEAGLQNMYANGEIFLYVTKKDNNYILNGNNTDNTTYAKMLADTYFKTYKEYLQSEYLTKENLPVEEVINIITVTENIKEQDNFMSNYIINYAFLFIIMAITISATYPATDTTAGEKERGTLETLLTFPIKSRDIIVGKFLSVSLSSFITGLISLVLTVVSLMFANNMFEIYKNVDLMLSPLSFIFAIVVIIAYSLLISGLCIAIASKCKTFKEAQSALTPLTFISFFPGMIAFMINIETSAILSLVPFLNYTLLFTDVTNGTVNILNVILMLLSTIIIIVVILVVIIKQYKSENVLFTN